MGVIVILQRGGRVEAVKTPERCPFPWCYERPITICVRVDGKRDFNTLREGKSGCEPYQPGESFIHDMSPQSRHLPKLLDVAEGLNYLHTSHTIHGDLKGAGASLGRANRPR